MSIKTTNTNRVSPYFVKTIYPIRKNIEIEQWWLASIPTEHFTINNLLKNTGSFNTYPITNYLKELDNYTLRKIIFTAVQSNDERALENCSFHRGWVDNRDESKSDQYPFVIRGRKLPELQANIQYWSGHEKSINFSPRFSSGYLTYGDKSKLYQWFGMQLIYAATEDLLSVLVKNAKDSCISYIRRNVAELEISIQELKKYINTLEEKFNCF